MKFLAVILPSLGTSALVLLFVLHLYDGFAADELAWGGLKIVPMEAKTKVSRSCHPETRQRGVLLVTTASPEKVQEFRGVENVYEKVWLNRKAFTEQHGTINRSISSSRMLFPLFHFLVRCWHSLVGALRQLGLTKLLGYELLFLDAKSFEISNQLHPVWSKFPAIQLAMARFPHVEWIWWLDLDAVIMSPSTDLYDLVLGPEAMAGRLLNGTTVKLNNRIKVDGEPVPTLVTGEVSPQWPGKKSSLP